MKFKIVPETYGTGSFFIKYKTRYHLHNLTDKFNEGSFDTEREAIYRAEYLSEKGSKEFDV